MPDRLSDELVSQLPSFLRDLVRHEDDEAVEPVKVAFDELSEDDQAVVEALQELGLGLVDAVEAVVRDRVPLALARHRRMQQARYTLAEMSERSGVPESVLEELHAAMGLPPRERYTKRELQNAKAARQFLSHLPREALVRSARARGTAMAAIVRSDIEIVREELLVPMRRAGADDLTLAVALAEALQALEGTAHETLIGAYDLLLDHQMSTELVALAARSGRDEVECAVGFVDVEGYTALSARIDGAGLDDVIESFERRVVSVTSADPEVSAVKYMGDAVMLVSADSLSLAHVLHQLTLPVEELADAPLRGGMAYGSVIVREGDFFGDPVNLAARLTDHARAWTVLASESTEADLAEHFEIRRLRSTRLRGIGSHRPISLLGPS